MEILLSAKKEILLKRDYKKVYKNKRNVVGKDRKFFTGTANIVIENTFSERLKEKGYQEKKIKEIKFH